MRARAGLRGATVALTAGMMATLLAAGPSTASGSAAAPLRGAAAAEAEADWTLMIYAVADTGNISEFMVRNLARFVELPEMPNVNVVALVDLPERDDPGAPSSRLPGLGDFTTAKLLKLEGGRFNEIRDLGEVAMGRPDVLAGFIEEAADRFPAKKYGLVLSDHGGAYTGGYQDIGPPSTTMMTVEDMRIGMLTGMQRAGIDRFELLDHDSCLMSSYEVVSALGPLVKTMVGSEEVTMGEYTLTNEAMATLGQDVSGAEWGEVNNENYATALDQDPLGGGAFTAMSIIDGDQMSQLDAAIESFSTVAVAHMDQIAPQVGLARSRALEFTVNMMGGESSMDTIDLGDFMRHLQDVPPEVMVARDAVFAALDGAVVSQVTRPATEQATGLNVFFPDTPDDVGFYLGLRVAPPGWARFVEAYAANSAGFTGDRSATFVSEQATILEQGIGGIRIAGQLGEGDADHATGTETQVRTELDGRQALAVVLPAYLNSGGEGQVQGVWDYGVSTITDGETSLPASSIYQAQSGGLLGRFFAHYVTPDGEESDVVFGVLLNSDGRITDVSVSAFSPQGALAGIELEVGGVLTPYIFSPAGDGSAFASTRSLTVTDGFEVRYPQLPAGTSFELGVVVRDMEGNESRSFASATVPEGRTR